jgi:hypothetical protein
MREVKPVLYSLGRYWDVTDPNCADEWDKAACKCGRLPYPHEPTKECADGDPDESNEA